MLLFDSIQVLYSNNDIQHGIVIVPKFLGHLHTALSHPAGRDKKVSVACCWIDFLSDLDTGSMLPDPGCYILERKQLHRNPTAAHSQLQ